MTAVGQSAADEVLDALDSTPSLFDFFWTPYRIAGDPRDFLSVQDVARKIGCSDTTARKSVHALVSAGLVDAYRVQEAGGVRRILVTGEARS